MYRGMGWGIWRRGVGRKVREVSWAGGVGGGRAGVYEIVIFR